MDAASLQRIEEKLDRLLDRVEALERGASAQRSGRRTDDGRRRPLAHDPSVERRLRERLDYWRRSGRLEDWARKVSERRARHADPDGWLRRMLDRADRDDPVKP